MRLAQRQRKGRGLDPHDGRPRLIRQGRAVSNVGGDGPRLPCDRFDEAAGFAADHDAVADAMRGDPAVWRAALACRYAASSAPLGPIRWRETAHDCATSLFGRRFQFTDQAPARDAATGRPCSTDALHAGFAIRSRLGIAASSGVGIKVDACAGLEAVAPGFLKCRTRLTKTDCTVLTRLAAHAVGPFPVVALLRLGVGLACSGPSRRSNGQHQSKCGEQAKRPHRPALNGRWHCRDCCPNRPRFPLLEW